MTVKYAKTQSGGRVLVPAVARAGNKLVVSSSRLLCHDLIDVLQEPQGEAVEERDLVFKLHSAPLSDLLENNRKEYFGHLVRDGRSARQALDNLKTIENLLATFSSLEGSSTAADGMFQLDVRGSLK